MAEAAQAARYAIRTRLLATFLILFVLTMLLTLVGIAGMRHNQRALEEFEAGVMPEIARVLELAEKVAQLAAVAPGIADADSIPPDERDSQLARTLLAEIRRLSTQLPAHADSRLEASAVLDGIDRDLTSLLAQSDERRRLKARLYALREQLDALGERLFPEREAERQRNTTLQAIWSSMVAATLADADTSLGRHEADAEALWIEAQRQHEDRRLPAVAAALQGLSEGPLGVFQLRRELLRTERGLNTDAQLMRAHATRLGERAGAYVSELRKVAAERRDAVRQSVSTGALGLMLLGGVAVLTALAGAGYGRRVLRQLQGMTGVMTRLAAGDTAQATPATERRDEIGELARAFQVFRDNLLEKQRLAQGLQAQGRLLETVFQSMHDGLSAYDAHGRLIAWNQKFASLLPLAPQRIGNDATVTDLNHALPAGAQWRAVSAETVTRAAGARIAASAELHLPDGRVLEFLSHPMPEGGWVAVCRDLTARLAVEAQLRQAQRMEVLGQLTGGVAHDFNNFLSAILGNLELLQSRLREDAALAGLASRAYRAADAAAGLSRRLLAFARREPLQVEAVRVGDMLAEMQDLIEFSVGAAVEVELQGEDSALWVQADRGQLENAVLNLSLNSAAAMPRGGRLTISVAPAASDAVLIRVADTGHGMPPDVQARVLEPFFTTRAPGQGSGLGLSIVDGFVRQCGGTLAIDSAEGRGTTIELRLPACAPPQPRTVPALADASRRRAARVLLVEDDEAVRETALALFEDLGVRARAVADEAAALECLAAEGPFDLVLSDVMLGAGGDGLGLLRQVAQCWPAQRVVLASGLPLEIHAQRPDWPAAQAFVQKPFTRKSLAALLD